MRLLYRGLGIYSHSVVLFFFFNDTATTEIYTLSLHDALPISADGGAQSEKGHGGLRDRRGGPGDRKSTRLNSSHLVISYAVFCLKKKKNPNESITTASISPDVAQPRQSTPSRAPYSLLIRRSV